MTGRILGMTCQIIFIYILCPVIYFCHIHNSLLHYIIITVIIAEVLSGFIYFLTIEKYLFALAFYAMLFFFDEVIRIYFHTVMCVSPSLRIAVRRCSQVFRCSWMYFLGAFQPATFLKRDSNKDAFQ